jgi:hypothetical protein
VWRELVNGDNACPEHDGASEGVRTHTCLHEVSPDITPTI